VAKKGEICDVFEAKMGNPTYLEKDILKYFNILTPILQHIFATSVKFKRKSLISNFEKTQKT
jgi:hypothetical protein